LRVSGEIGLTVAVAVLPISACRRIVGSCERGDPQIQNTGLDFDSEHRIEWFRRTVARESLERTNN